MTMSVTETNSSYTHSDLYQILTWFLYIIKENMFFLSNIIRSSLLL